MSCDGGFGAVSVQFEHGLPYFQGEDAVISASQDGPLPGIALRDARQLRSRLGRQQREDRNIKARRCCASRAEVTPEFARGTGRSD